MTPPPRPGAARAGRIVVLHLRASSGAGGGPEKTILGTAATIDRSRFDYRVAYLRRTDQDIAPIREQAARSGANLSEISGRAVFDLGQVRAVAALVRSLRADILHAHDPKTDLLALMLAPFFPGLRRVTTLHGWVAHQGSAKSALYVRLDKLALPGFHAVIAVSRAIAAEARRYRAKNILLLHNAIDTDWWRPENAPPPPRDPGQPFVVGFSGRLRHEKGPLIFLETARRLLAADASLRFAVAGTGPQEAEAKAMAAGSELAGKVAFHGRLDPEGMRVFYRGLDCLLSPSLTEGLPNTLLEAMAMGTPVAATAVGGVPDLVRDGENGLLRPSGDVSGLAGAVARLKADPGLARRLAENARATVERDFSFAERTKRLMALYEGLISGRRRP